MTTKSTSILAIICMVFLLVLSYYTIEDLPTFGDPDSSANRYTRLGISLYGSDIIDELNKEAVSPKLNDELKKKGFPELSDRKSVV